LPTIKFRILCLSLSCQKNIKIVILPFVVYEYETWSLTQREEDRLRVLENGVPRRIFVPMREEGVGGWIILHNLYASPNIIRVIKSRRIRWMGHVAHMGEMRNVYKILVRKPEGKRLLGRPRHIWEGNIGTD
jgi:hypothetical protein